MKMKEIKFAIRQIHAVYARHRLTDCSSAAAVVTATAWTTYKIISITTTISLRESKPTVSNPGTLSISTPLSCTLLFLLLALLLSFQIFTSIPKKNQKKNPTKKDNPTIPTIQNVKIAIEERVAASVSTEEGPVWIGGEGGALILIDGSL